MPFKDTPDGATACENKEVEGDSCGGETDFNEIMLNDFAEILDQGTPTLQKGFILNLISQVRADEKANIKSKIMGMVCDDEIDDLTASKIINKIR